MAVSRPTVAMLEEGVPSLPETYNESYLLPGEIVDSDHPDIRSKADELCRGKPDDISKAVALFYFVRDSIRYNLFVERDRMECFKASRTLASGEGYCVQKAVLLAALARAAGLPAGLGYARIQNHLLPEKTLRVTGTTVLPFHGYTILWLGGRWVRATPAWDAKMCQKLNTFTVEFDGRSDAMLPAFNREGKQQVEYLKDLGYYPDVPLEKLWAALRATYGTINLKRPAAV